jgi:hypothetical protein
MFVSEEDHLLGCDAVWSSSSTPTFRRNVLSQMFRSKRERSKIMFTYTLLLLCSFSCYGSLVFDNKSVGKTNLGNVNISKQKQKTTGYRCKRIKLSLCLINWSRRHDDERTSGRIAPPLLTSATLPPGKDPPCPLDRKLGERQSRACRCGSAGNRVRVHRGN